MDAQTKRGVSLVIGPRSQANAEALWQDVAQRTDGTRPELITTDEYRAYAGALLTTYGLPQPVRHTGKPGRPRTPRLVPPRDLVYAMVHKLRRKGRVVKVTLRRVFGTARPLARALARSRVSTHINTSFVERFNATVRQHNSRKARKVYTFSKAFEPHQAMSWFALSYYNFCRPHLGLRVQVEGRWRVRTPAMVADITDHVWSIREFMDSPLIHQSLVSVPYQ